MFLKMVFGERICPKEINCVIETSHVDLMFKKLDSSNNSSEK